MLSPTNPVRHALSYHARVLIRRIQDFANRRNFARHKDPGQAPHRIASHSSPIRRRLKDVDPQLFENKKRNLEIAIQCLNGATIQPGQTFSFWHLVGQPTRKKGYLEGLVISKGNPTKGVGGGLCQLSNALFWLALHSDLKVLERHRHSFDLFPDADRTVPFGTGATVVYNYKDLRFFNPTNDAYQFRFTQDEDYVYSDLHCSKIPEHQYAVKEVQAGFYRKLGETYRTNSIVRNKMGDGEQAVFEELLFKNDCKCQYEPEEVAI